MIAKRRGRCGYCRERWHRGDILWNRGALIAHKECMVAYMAALYCYKVSVTKATAP